MNALPPAPFDAWNAPRLCEQPARPPQPNGELLRVVVIEDNRDAADTLRILLEILGNEVRVAYTGPEGVKAVTAWRPDAVISDIGLPGLDGYGVARELRRDPAAARLLLIGLSGYGSEDDVARAREAGFDYYLVKPASSESLQRLLTNGAGRPDKGERQRRQPAGYASPAG